MRGRRATFASGDQCSRVIVLTGRGVEAEELHFNPVFTGSPSERKN